MVERVWRDREAPQESNSSEAIPGDQFPLIRPCLPVLLPLDYINGSDCPRALLVDITLGSKESTHESLGNIFINIYPNQDLTPPS